MFHHAVVGVDDQDGGRDAIALARTLASQEITLVSAYPTDRLPLRGASAGYEAILREDAHRTLDAAVLESGLAAQTEAVGAASPARALHDVAEATGADLIIVGSSHRGAAGRVLLGDVSRSVLHHAPIPVVVPPHGYRLHARPIRPVAVGYDGSAEAAIALRTGAGIRDELAARLMLVGAVVIDVPIGVPALGIDWDAILDEERSAVEQSLRAGLASIGGSGDVRAELGTPGAVLTRASTHADLLVVGSRGRGAVWRIVLGSTSDRVVHRAACPVFVVTRAAIGFGAWDAAASASAFA